MARRKLTKAERAQQANPDADHHVSMIRLELIGNIHGKPTVFSANVKTGDGFDERARVAQMKLQAKATKAMSQPKK